MDHPSPAEHGQDRPTKRMRSAVACSRCKARRQKCDNAQPACSNCAKAGEQCSYTGSANPSWYVKSLEDHIAKLEQRLQGVDSSYAADHLQRGQRAVSSPDATSPSAPNHLGSSLGFLSLLAAGEPYYLGMNGGFSLGSLVQAALNQVEQGNAVESPVATGSAEMLSPGSGQSNSPLSLPRPEDRPFSCHVPKATTKPASIPTPELGNALLTAYLATVHRSYPFLDRDRLILLHKEVTTRTTGSTTPSRKALVKLHLVYGIGARQLQLSSGSPVSFERSLPEAHYVAAVSLLRDAFEIRGMENIELLLLLSLYSLHSPSGPGVWHLCGIALRLSVEMGLHKGVQHLPAGMYYHDQARKRLFWSCYLLERKICITLGRPVSLSDADIDVQFPNSGTEETVMEQGIPMTDLTHQGHLVRLHQISSRNQRIDGTNLLELGSKRALLDQWYETVKGSKTEEALTLEYYKMLRVMLQPYIMQPERDESVVVECARVAGAICQSYKRLQMDDNMGMYLLELHDVLMGGITLIYCARIRPDILNPYIVSTDLGAASTVLFIVATRWASAKKYRDAFECLVANTMKYFAEQRPAEQPVAQTAVPPVPIALDPSASLDGAGIALWESGVDDDVWKMLVDMTGMPNMGMSMEGDPSWMCDISERWDNNLTAL